MEKETKPRFTTSIKPRPTPKPKPKAKLNTKLRPNPTPESKTEPLTDFVPDFSNWFF